MAAAILLLAAGLFLGACGGGGSDTSDQERTDVTQASDTPAQPGGRLVYGLGAETDNWNPATARWGASGTIVANSIFDRLVAYDEDEQPVPYLLEALTPNEDFTEWTMDLREGPVFHDGTPVDADAIALNIEALRESPLTASGTRPIENVIPDNDAGTVVIEMNSPWSTFPHMLTWQPGYVMAPAMIEDPEGSRNPVGSGPFTFEEWVPDDHLTVEKNEDYWRDGFPLLDAIEFRVIADSTSRGQALENGDIDIMETNEAGQMVEFEEKAQAGDFQAFLDPDGDTQEIFVGLNTAKPPFDNPTARLAVATAIDKQAISDTVYEGIFEPATGPFKPNSPWYTEGDAPTFDTAEAARLADEYEAETGEPLSFSLNVTPDPNVVRVAELGQQQLAAAGIEMDIKRLDQTQLLLEGLGGQFEATGFILFGAPHLDREYVFMHGDNVAPIGQSALAFTRMDNDTLDAALDAARETGDEDEQMEQYRIVQEELAKDLAFVFLVHSEAANFAQNNVRDVVSWTFPDSDVKGLGQEGSVIMTYQIWLED
jgi:peptide/nickel transport system substrate-binding protein